MSEKSKNNPINHPEITEDGCKAIRRIFWKYDNVDESLLQNIIDLVRKRTDENKIIKMLGISKNKLYRLVCIWMVQNSRNIWVMVSPRKRGKNNYNKYMEKIDGIKQGLDNGLAITKLCKFVGLSHQTMVKYLYRLMYLERKKIFA